MKKYESFIESYLKKRKKAEEKAMVDNLPFFKHATEKEREEQLAEQRKITENATDEDILSGVNEEPKPKESTEPQETDDEKDSGDKYWTTKADWQNSKRKSGK